MNLNKSDGLEERNNDTRLASALYISTATTLWYWGWWVDFHATKTLRDLSWYRLNVITENIPTVLFLVVCIAFFIAGLLISFAPEKVRKLIFPLVLTLWPLLYMTVKNFEWQTRTEYCIILVFILLALSTIHSYRLWCNNSFYNTTRPWISSEDLKNKWPIIFMAICIFIFFLGTAIN